MDADDTEKPVSIKMEIEEPEPTAQESANLAQFLDSVGATLGADDLSLIKVEPEEEETVAEESVIMPFLDFVRHFLEDNHFQQMEAVLRKEVPECLKTSLTKENHGDKPLELEQQPLTNKLLLQLVLLRQKTKSSWETIYDIFQKVTDASSLQDTTLHNEVRRCIIGGTELQGQSPISADIENYLSVDIAAELSVRHVGPHLLKHNITRKHIHDPELLKQLPLPSEVTKGMVIDLVKFLRQCGKGVLQCRPFLNAFGIIDSEVSDCKLTRQLRYMMDKYGKFKKGNRGFEQQRLHTFLNETVTFKIAPPPPVTENSLLAKARMELTAAGRQLREKEYALSQMNEKYLLLQEITRERSQTISRLEQELSEVTEEKTQAIERLEEQLPEAQATAKMVVRLEKQLQKANIRLAKSQQQLKEARATLSGFRKSAYYRQFKRKERALKMKEGALAGHGNEGTVARTSGNEGNLLQARESWIVSEAHSKPTIVDVLHNQPKTQKKDPYKEKFSYELKKTVSELIAAKVSSLKCSKVIHIVAKHLFQKDMPLEHLPSETTARRFARQGRLLALMPETEADTEGTSYQKMEETCSQEVVQGPAEATMEDVFSLQMDGTSVQQVSCEQKYLPELTSKVKKTIEELAAARVPPKVHSKAIQIVAKHLFHMDMPVECLPSENTAGTSQSSVEMQEANSEIGESDLIEDETSDVHEDETSDLPDTGTPDQKVKLEVPWSVKEEPHDPEAACHTCQYCSAIFILSSSLQVHLESFHGETQPAL